MFRYERLKNIGFDNSQSPAVYSYETAEDSLTSVYSDGYFSDPRARLRQGDFIIVNASDGSGTVFMSSSTSGSQPNFAVTGWAQYGDTQYTSGSPFVVAEGVRSQLPNNALSSITSLYDPATGKITPETVGDGYMIRINFKSFTNNQNGTGEVSLDIGDGSEIEILEIPVTFPRGTGSGNVRPYTTSSFIYSLDSFVANGGKVYYESIRGQTSIYNISFVIERTHKGR